MVPELRYLRPGDGVTPLSYSPRRYSSRTSKWENAQPLAVHTLLRGVLPPRHVLLLFLQVLVNVELFFFVLVKAPPATRGRLEQEPPLVVVDGRFIFAKREAASGEDDRGEGGSVA